MADQSRRQWAGDRLPDDLLYEMARLIPCVFDRVNMVRFRHSWHVAFAKINLPAPPPQLPWLLLAEDGEHGLTFSCALSSCRTHPFYFSDGAHRSRYFGSYDGAWLFLAIGGQAQRHLLFTFSDPSQAFVLPNLARVNIDLDFSIVEHQEMAIVAATLSCQPTEQGCIFAGIIEFPTYSANVDRQTAFWRMGDQVVLPPNWEWAAMTPLMDDVVEDLIYHNGSFHFLTGREYIIACEEPPVFREDMVVLTPVNMYFLPRGRGNDETILARCLVESRRKLLMVVRLTNRRQDLPTLAFRVFQKEELSPNDVKVGEPYHNYGALVQFRYYWSELEKLDGRMLFLGRGCSRSYEVKDGYPGMEGIYFLDDRSFHQPINGGADKLPYRCSDNVKWTKAPPGQGQVDRCFPKRGTSIYSRPVWVLP